MIKYTFLGILSLILTYIGLSLGYDTWYGFTAIFIGAFMFIIFYSIGISKENELINRINELEKVYKSDK